MKRQDPTAHDINAAKPGVHYYGNGLCLKVSPDGGTRRWMLRYTSLVTRKPTETRIGPWPAVSYKDARAKIARQRQLIAQGIDPVQARRQERAKGTTFAEACEAWINTRKARWRSIRQVKILLSKHGLPLAEKAISQITRTMVQQALSDLWRRHPEQARRALSVWKRVFDYAKAMEMRTGDNPATWRGDLEYVFDYTPSGKHYPHLPFKLMPKFIEQLRLRQMKAMSALVLEFQILTATRPGEARGMRWSEVGEAGLINRIWTIPAERTKQKRQHRVPLSERCMEILALQNEYRINDFVFLGYNNTAMDEKAARMLLRTMVKGIAPHGFRATFRNWAAAMYPQDRHLAKMCSGHLIKDKVEAAYWRDDALDARRPIMDAWADYCGSGITQTTESVPSTSPVLLNR
jgi:integrase